MFPLRDDRPHSSPPVVTLVLIALNVLVFIFEMLLAPSTRNAFIATWGIIPDREYFRPITLVTSMFLHGGWMHIISNMMFLWAFGRSLEDGMGRAKYLLFYMLCGVAAGLTQVFFNPDLRVPTVGASGAIAAVMGAYMITYPRAYIHTLIFIFVFVTTTDIPAVFILGYWFLTQLFNGVGTIGYSHVSQGGTAWFAHIGGFLAGIVAIKLLGIDDVNARRRRVTW
ncbi:MAG TPA: rhomboid family intramembrane serine protease [Solibacterales bacterium]|nr:rhomboid family intramembrane serine protease [Bryobacterales bacterium]